MGTEFKNVDHSRFAKEPRLYFVENKDRSGANPYKFYCDAAKKGTDFSCLVVITRSQDKTNKVSHLTVEEVNKSEHAQAYNNWLVAHWSITKGENVAAALKHYRLKLPLAPTLSFLAVEQEIAKNKTEALALCVALAARGYKPYSMTLTSLYNSHQSEIQQALHNNEVAAKAKALQAEKTAQAMEDRTVSFIKAGGGGGGVAVLHAKPTLIPTSKNEIAKHEPYELVSIGKVTPGLLHYGSTPTTRFPYVVKRYNPPTGGADIGSIGYYTVEAINQERHSALAFNEWLTRHGKAPLESVCGTCDDRPRLLHRAYMQYFTPEFYSARPEVFHAIELTIAQNPAVAFEYVHFQTNRGYKSLLSKTVKDVAQDYENRTATSKGVEAVGTKWPSQHEEDSWMPTRPQTKVMIPAPKSTPEKTIAPVPYFSLFIPGDSRRGQQMKLPNTFTKEQSDAIRRFIGDSLVTSRLQSIVVVTENNPQGKVIGAHTMEGINQHALAMPFNNFVANTKTLAWMAGYMSKLALAASTNPAVKTGAYQTSPVEQKLANSPEHAYTFYTALEKAGFPWQPWNTDVIIAANRHKVNVINKKEKELQSTKNKIFWSNLLPFVTGLVLFVPMLAYFIKTRSMAVGGFSLLPLALIFFSIAFFITESKQANKTT